MKKAFVLFIGLFFFCNIVFAQTDAFEKINNGDEIYYSLSTKKWYKDTCLENHITFKKKLYEGTGSYSQFLDPDNKIAFTLTTNYEFLKDGDFIAIDNNELKYYKVIHNGDFFEEIPLTYSEIQNIFPNAELISLALMDSDNKQWIHKPFFKKKEILFVNDSEKYYHKLTAKNYKIQNQDIRGLITVSRYGIYNFIHFGERDGKITIYVR